MAKDMRTFIGLRVGPEAQRRIHRQATRLAELNPDMRPITPEDLHITLQFLGGTTDDDVWRVSRALAAIGETQPPIDVEYVGLGAFPALDRARVVWTGVREAPGTEGRLAALVEAVGKAMGELGYPAERRKHHPHVSMGRLRKTPPPAWVEAVESGADLDLGAEILSEVKLIVSDPSHRPYHYIDLTTVDLDGFEGEDAPEEPQESEDDWNA